LASIDSAPIAIDNPRAILDPLDEVSALAKMREPLRVRLEITEVADRVMKQPGGGKALLFDRPVLDDGSPCDIPVAINTCGS
jgi:4-hydroxy-3-polyprenylbenzoate decarboxylase